MAIRRSSDSLSRCDPTLYSNIYDVRKRPDLKPSAVSAAPKDTIEISREKLKKEALAHLRQPGKYLIAYNSFMRVGKYLFLAIAFPPYLMLYGLPKWIILEGFPVIFSFPMWMWRKVKQKTEKQVETSVSKVTQMIQWMRKMGTNLLIQPVVRLTFEIRRRIQRMREQTFHFLGQIIARARSTLHKPSLAVKETFKRLSNQLSRLKEKFIQQTEIIAVQLQKIQWIKETPQMILGWGQSQIQRFHSYTTAWGNQWNKRFDTSQKFAHRATQWVANQSREVVTSLKQRLAPFVTFYQRQLQPRWQKFKDKWKQAGDFFHRKHQKALSYLQNKQERLKNLSHHHFMSRLLSKLPFRLQLLLKKWLSHPVCRAIFENGVKIYAFLARNFWGILSRLLQLLSAGVKMVAKITSLVKVYLQIGKRVSSSILQIMLHTCRKLALYTLYYFLLGMVMATILMIWGFRSLDHLLHSLQKRIRFLISN